MNALESAMKREKKNDAGKTIVDYLKEYKPHLYHINKITKYIYP